MNPAQAPGAYRPRRQSESRFLELRGLRHHVRVWEPSADRPLRGTLLMLHGWMDVSASFQFIVDALADDWRVYAPDWRGYGLTDRSGADSYWFADYLADLDRLLDALSPDEPASVVAHSMGGNVAMLYAGVRPERIARLINLEGMGLPATEPSQAPQRYQQWLDELRDPPGPRYFASIDEIAQRLMRNDPRLSVDKAEFLGAHWAQALPDGRLELAGDPAHRIVNPVLYRVEEAVACWRQISAPVLLVVSERFNDWHAFVDSPEYQQRLGVIRELSTVRIEGSGHMLHHDRPDEVARLIEGFMT